VRGAEEALAAAERLGYPVALKVSSPEIAHKSERGGVLLDIRGPDELRAAFATFRERFPADDAVVQEMVPPGIELIIGGRRDPQTGPVVMAGFGGVLTEVLDDVVFCRVPTPTAAALGALASLRGQQLLDGYRNLPSVDRGAVAEVLERLSAILAANPDIVEVDLNPVIAGERGLIVADALIRAQ
jgi:acetyl-CoA synthetase